MNNILSIDDLKLNVNLGLTKKERAKKQSILLNTEIMFSKSPKATLNDKIDDTVCYHTLIDIIKKYCANKEYALIEHLCHELYVLIKLNIPDNCKLKLKITKFPPIKNVKSCSYTQSELDLVV